MSSQIWSTGWEREMKKYDDWLSSWVRQMLVHLLTAPHSHPCMHAHAQPHTLAYTHTHKEKRCNWLSMIRLFLDPQTLPLIKILICRTILEAVDWYIMCNICLPPVSCSETQTDTWYLWISPFLTVIMTTCDQQSFESGFFFCRSKSLRRNRPLEKC